MTSNPLFQSGFPAFKHTPTCMCAVGACSCGADAHQREFEQALIALQGAVDGRGLHIRLGGRLEEVHMQVADLCSRLIDNGRAQFLQDPQARITGLRHLELLARVYRLYLEHLPRHLSSCSNQNVLDPLGAYHRVAECGCNRA